MDSILVLVADQARARLFMSETRAGNLMELSDFANPEGRLHEGDLTTGEVGSKSGRTHIDGSNLHPTTVENNALERSAERFALDLNSELEKFVQQHRPARIHVIAPPKFLGLLRAKWSKTVSALIDEEIAKDVSKFTTEEIREHLPDFV